MRLRMLSHHRWAVKSKGAIMTHATHIDATRHAQSTLQFIELDMIVAISLDLPLCIIVDSLSLTEVGFLMQYYS